MSDLAQPHSVGMTHKQKASPMKERIQKLLARANYGSRRASEQIILEGRVTVNGKRATLGDQADPEVDDVRVDGERLRLNRFKLRYFAFNKPKNVLSTNEAPPGDERPTVRSLLPVDGHYFTIGRLDAESEGLIVMTNDGDIAHKLTHPSFQHTKTYKVTVYGHPSEEALRQWQEGVWIDGKRTAPCLVRVMEKSPQMTTLRVIMTEGRKRQIRQIASQLGYPVNRLVRTHIGQLALGTLARGEWVELTEEDVSAMLMPSPEFKAFKRALRRRRFSRSPQETAAKENAAAPQVAATPQRPKRKLPPRPSSRPQHSGGRNRPDSPKRRSPSKRPGR